MRLYACAPQRVRAITRARPAPPHAPSRVRYSARTPVRARPSTGIPARAHPWPRAPLAVRAPQRITVSARPRKIPCPGGPMSWGGYGILGPAYVPPSPKTSMSWAPPRGNESIIPGRHPLNILFPLRATESLLACLEHLIPRRRRAYRSQ